MGIASEQRLKNVIDNLMSYDPERILVFGSHARGEADEYSDLDLVVIKDTSDRFLDRLEAVYRHIQPDYALDVLVYTPGEFAALLQEGRTFAKEVVQDGIVIYDRAPGAQLGQLPARPVRKEWSTMKREEEGSSWLEQAKADLAAAEWLLQGEHYHAACFWAQQVAEKALKAFLYLQGERRIVDHSIYRLCQSCAEYEPSLAQLAKKLGVLDRFYIPTRYPNGLPLGGIPAQIYGPEDAQRALALARQAIEIVQARTWPSEPEPPNHSKIGDEDE